MQIDDALVQGHRQFSQDRPCAQNMGWVSQTYSERSSLQPEHPAGALGHPFDYLGWGDSHYPMGPLF